MIKKLTMTCFRKVQQDTMTFGDGLNVIRGANESSKTTRIEAIAYALFGASALRTTLAEAVTWGCKEGELKVTLDIVAEGKLFTFCRSKGGAEVTLDGNVHVTGQKEVTAFAAQLIGCDPGTATRLMFANQGALRGALEQGSKATTDLLESLAGLTQFDEIIEAMQTHLVIGTPSMVEMRIQKAEQKLSECPEPVMPDLSEIKEKINEINSEVNTSESDVVKLKIASRDAYSLWQNAENLQRVHDVVVNTLHRHQRDLALHEEQLATVRNVIAQCPGDSEIAEARNELEAARNRRQLRAAYDTVCALVKTYPESFWEGDRASFDTELEDSEKRVKALAEKISGVKADMRVWAAQVVQAKVCPTCGQDTSKSELVVENNRRLAEKMESASAALMVLARDLKEAEETVAALKAISKVAHAYDVASALPNVEYDKAFVPTKVWWSGEVPSEYDNEKEVANRLAALNERADTSRRARGQEEVLIDAIQNDRGAIARATAELETCPAPGNIDALRAAANKAAEEAIVAEGRLSDLKAELDALGRKLMTAAEEYQRALDARQMLVEEVEVCREELAELHFNNALLKKIRAIRPIVANKLWDRVMSAVSVMFSSMRGEQSVIAKGKGGFTCNGAAVESLSGSALDLLGLAIRVGLTKTFLPHWRTLILDEPAAACSEERTRAMLGFIASSGFDQVLLVTHDEISESVADSLVVL